MNGDPLLAELRSFANKLAEKNIRFIIGGGYGLLLKVSHIQRTGARTRIEQIPIARSTGDIDVFLTSEVITDPNNMAEIRNALDELDYSPVVGAEYYQFFREIAIGGTKRNIKFDFLAAPVSGEQAKKVKSDVRRIRPRGATKVPMHAHTTPEAFTIEEHLIEVDIGERDKPLPVFLPHPFSYMLLKLFALRDQLDNEKKDFGRNHAFDLYLTWAMMTEDELNQMKEFLTAYSSTEVVAEAIEIAGQLFRDENALGTIRLREHAQTENLDLVQVADFSQDVGGMFQR